MRARRERSKLYIRVDTTMPVFLYPCIARVSSHGGHHCTMMRFERGRSGSGSPSQYSDEKEDGSGGENQHADLNVTFLESLESSGRMIPRGCRPDAFIPL